MKYVDDLSKYIGREDEIVFTEANHKVLGIVYRGDTQKDYPYVVVTEYGRHGAYTRDGREFYTSYDTQLFFVKPKKVRYLRTIKELVDEGYEPYLRFVTLGDKKTTSLAIKGKPQELYSSIEFIGKPIGVLEDIMDDEWLEIFTVLKEEEV